MNEHPFAGTRKIHPRCLIVALFVAALATGLPETARAGKKGGKWVLMATEGAPPAAQKRVTVWTGEQMLVFSEEGGGAFDPVANRWRPVAVEGMPGDLLEDWDNLHDRPILAGDQVIFLYPEKHGSLVTYGSEFVGAIYDIPADRWTAMPFSEHTPGPRKWPVTVWTGEKLFVWGGVGEEAIEGAGERAVVRGDGAMLDPATATWTPISADGAPCARSAAAGIWTGSRVVVWGGLARQSGAANLYCSKGTCDVAAGGALYDPVTDRWEPMSDEGAPWPRAGATVMMADGAVVVFGGTGTNARPVSSGGVYHPGSDSWSAFEGGPGLEGHPRPYIDTGRLVVHGSKHNAAVYDFESRAWRKLDKAGLPPRTGWASYPIGDPGMLRVATPQTGMDGLQGSVARIDAADAVWRVAAFPAGEAPVSLETLSTIWTGETLIFWGGATRVVDPDGSNGCGDVDRPCDPVTPTKQVWSSAGAMFTPAFSVDPPTTPRRPRPPKGGRDR